jgi:LPXTG-site transpeptidase (sortase) family protein
MTGAAKWLRRLEIAFTVVGISFLGGAFAATLHRWDYQARQERAIFQGAVSSPLRGDRAVSPFRGDTTANPLLAVGATNPLRGDRAANALRVNGADPLALGRIEIPRIGIKAIVREGTDDETLSLAVGHVRGTASPGENGNTVLAGHRDTFFWDLRDIRMNDRVRLVVPPRTYEYRVVSIEVVAPDDTRVLDPTKEEALTLVTCYPFQYIGNAPERFIVRAARAE